MATPKLTKADRTMTDDSRNRRAIEAFLVFVLAAALFLLVVLR